MIIANLSKSIYELYHKKDLLISTQKKLSTVEKENTALKKQLSVVQNPAFIEQEARDKLFLAKPGESSLLVPSQTPERSSSDGADTKSHWQEWLDLFFGQ